MSSDPILAAQYWNSNASMIADCARLGYLDEDWLTLDPTYGKGNWWKEFSPNKLIAHDIKIDGVDFRDLPYDDEYFDAVAYDPPYVSVGGRSTSGMPGFLDAYGLEEAPRTPDQLQEYINSGLVECARVLKKKGFLLVKCQDYISSGKLWIGTHWTQRCAISEGLEVVDRLEYLVAAPRPQPPGRKQVHARRNYSTLFVFQKKYSLSTLSNR